LKGPIVIEPLSEGGARAGATLNAGARRRGQELSTPDSLIAGHAIALGATLVTSDGKLAAAMSEFNVISWR
jgi:predicted nucleic acid-binding protein